MPAQQQTSTKRRGRVTPPSDDADDAALQARRERNREAQNIFRRRRQVAEKVQAERVSRLEGVIEEMSSVFVSFVDEVLQTDVIRVDPSLTSCLRRTTSRILALAHEVVGPDDVDAVVLSPAPSIASKLGLPARSTKRRKDDASLELEATSIANSDPPPFSDVGTMASTAHHGSHFNPSTALDSMPVAMPISPPQDLDMETITPNTAYASPVTTTTSSTFSQQQPTASQLAAQIFGSDWISNPFTMLNPHAMSGTSGSAPLSPDSLAYRLALTSLSRGYLVLTRAHDPPVSEAEFQRIFGSTLRFRSRDVLASRIRWILGPGREHMFRVADLPGGRYGAAEFSRTDLNPSTPLPACIEDVEKLAAAQEEYHRLVDSSSPPFLSALGVERQLLALGARVVDSETLEIDVSAMPALDADTDKDGVLQPDSWSYVNFFSPSPPRKQSFFQRQRLSIDRLVANLVKQGVCLVGGPGFPRDRISDAIKSSLITA